jgi:mannose-6-phosphate isomerase-like protein (cupin superfamily)
MKVISESQAVSFANSKICYGIEYQFASTDLNVAVITVNGRYPAEGHLVNEVCNEVGYVLSGSGTIGVDEQVHALNPGDAVFVNPGERFYWEGDHMKMVVPCSPAFYPEQHKEVD